jgi:hypothetical protein
LTDTEVAGSLLEERVLCGLLVTTGLSLRERRGRGLLSFRWLSLRKKEHQHNLYRNVPMMQILFDSKEEKEETEPSNDVTRLVLMSSSFFLQPGHHRPRRLW